MGKTNRLKSARIRINETLDEKYREEKYEEFLNIAEIMMMNYAENAVKEERKLKQEGKSEDMMRNYINRRSGKAKKEN